MYEFCCIHGLVFYNVEIMSELFSSKPPPSNSRNYQGMCRLLNKIQPRPSRCKIVQSHHLSPLPSNQSLQFPLPNYSSPGSSTTKSTLTSCIPKSSSLTEPGTAAREMPAASSTMSLATFIPIRALVSIVEMKLSMPDV